MKVMNSSRYSDLLTKFDGEEKEKDLKEKDYSGLSMSIFETHKTLQESNIQKHTLNHLSQDIYQLQKSTISTTTFQNVL